jgi:hypothetical protein
LATAWLQYRTQSLNKETGSCARNANRRTYCQYFNPFHITKKKTTWSLNLLKKLAWVGDDFPNSLYDVPSQDLNVPSAIGLDNDPVALIIENSKHYGLTSPSGDDDLEYWSMFPGLVGVVHLGPERRFFGTSLYHQVRT